MCDRNLLSTIGWPMRMALSGAVIVSLCGCGNNKDNAAGKQDISSPKRGNATPRRDKTAKTMAGGRTVSTGPAAGLFAARAGFQTQLRPSTYRPDGPAASPPAGVFDMVKYPSPVGNLVAYVTPDPKSGKRHPAVLWAHGGFGGIGDFFWGRRSPENDQSAGAFREAGIVLMCPSWRGENDNPGRFELYFGEVNDLLAARDYLASLPYVDPNRIYLGGHSTGGTLALLTATATDKFRAIFSFGGNPDVAQSAQRGVITNSPFDPQSAQEGRLRSAINFVAAIKTPTFYFEGQASPLCENARLMERRAKAYHVPFTACIIPDANHFNILSPLTSRLASEILKDTGPQCRIAIDETEAKRIVHSARADFRKRREQLVDRFPIIELSPSAIAKVKAVCRSESLDVKTTFLRIDRDSGRWKVGFDNKFSPVDDVKLRQGTITIVVSKKSVPKVRGFLLTFRNDSSSRGFQFIDRVKVP